MREDLAQSGSLAHSARVVLLGISVWVLATSAVLLASTGTLGVKVQVGPTESGLAAPAPPLRANPAPDAEFEGLLTGHAPPQNLLGAPTARAYPDQARDTWVAFNRSTVPGVGSFAPPSLPAGLAVDSRSGVILVGDQAGNAVYTVNGSTGIGVTIHDFGNQANGNLVDPLAATYDPGANLFFVAATDANLVYALNATTLRVSGNPVPVGSGPDALVVDDLTGLLFVANVGSSNVTVINTTSMSVVVPGIPTGQEPEAMALDLPDGKLFVANYASLNLSVISLRNNSVLTPSIGLGGNRTNFPSPAALLYDPSNGELYSANQAVGNISILNASSESFVGSPIHLKGSDPTGLALDPASGLMFVSNTGPGLGVVDTSNNSLVGQGVAALVDPYYVAWNGFDSSVVTLNVGSLNLSEYSPGLGKVTRPSINLSASFLRETFDPLNGLLYLATPNSGLPCTVNGTVTVLRPYPTTAVVATIPAGRGTEALTLDNRTNELFAANYCSNDVTVINGTTNTVLATISVGSAPINLAYDWATDEVYVADSAADNVTVISAKSLTVTYPAIPVGVNPDGVACDPEDGLVYVADYGSGNLTPINTSSHRSMSSWVPTGAFPEGAVYDPQDGLVFVANAGSRSVSVIEAASATVMNASIRTVNGPVEVVWDSVSDYVYVIGAVANEVGIIDAASLSALPMTIPVVSSPLGAAYDSSQNLLLVSGFSSGSVATLVAAPFVASLNVTPNVTEVGDSITVHSTVTDGVLPYSFVYTGLPPGCLSVNLSTIWCSPAVPGAYQITLTVTDAAGNSSSSSVWLTVAGKLTMMAVEASPPVIEVGTYTTLSAWTGGGFPPISFSWTGLPPGCTGGDSSNLSCGPSVAGAYLVDATATDSLGNLADGYALLNVVTELVEPILIATPATLTLGDNLTLFVADSGGVAPYGYSYSGLPPGCLPSNVSVISCTPGVVGNYTPTVTVTDALGSSASARTSVIVRPGVQVTQPVFVFGVFASPSVLTLGTPLDLQTIAVGGSGSLRYAYSGLPSGCASLDSQQLSCVPNETGNFSVSVTVSDAQGSSSYGSVGVEILPSPSPAAVGGTSSIPLALLLVASVALGIVGGAASSIVVLRIRRDHPPVEEEGRPRA